MKKLLCFTALAFAALHTYGQSQRLVLVEEFTQASCPPCASQNPAFNTFLNTNSAKTTSIKYQTSWPGVDPMNAHNPTQVATRVSYYGVTGVPNIVKEGTAQSAPSAITQADIDARYATPSPYTIALTHSFSAGYDSVIVTANVTLTAANADADQRLHLAVVEKAIIFATAPGSNGEKDFYNVLKKMLPTDQGTTLPAMTVGQTVTVTEKWKLSNIYDLNQVSVVGFIQVNGSKVVHQAAVSNPLVLGFSNYGVANSVSGVSPVFNCGTANFASPAIIIKNVGTGTLTSATIEYGINNFTNTYNWTGSLAANGTVNVPLSAINSSTIGLGKVQARVVSSNGIAIITDTKEVDFVLYSPTGGAVPIAQNFVSTTFPPAGNYFNRNVLNDGFTITRSNAGNGNAGSLKYDSYNITAGRFDEFILPNLNFSSAPAPSTLKLYFDHAYAQYATENDKIDVLVSNNCGTSWTNVFSKAGAALATSAVTTSAFTPTTAAQWKNDTVDLSSYITQTNTLVAFRMTSQYGNNMYIDNINIVPESTVGVNTFALLNGITIAPNPVKDIVTINTQNEFENAVVTLHNAIGQSLYQKTLQGTRATLNMANYPQGTYVLKIVQGGKSYVQKITKL
jgi:hypothetical protein